MLHASDYFMEVGHIIRPTAPDYHNGIGYWERHSGLVTARRFHDYKPAGQIGHDEAVFIAHNIHDLSSIGYNYHNYMYEVIPLGKISEHDIAWHDGMIGLFDIDQELTEEMIPDAARRYWSGEIRGASEGHTGHIEILAEAVKIIGRKAINKTKTGYVQDDYDDIEKHPSLLRRNRQNRLV